MSKEEYENLIYLKDIFVKLRQEYSYFAISQYSSPENINREIDRLEKIIKDLKKYKKAKEDKKIFYIK